MKRFTDAIAKAVTEKNWLAAAALALTMPDICGRTEHPEQYSPARYKAWWDKYMLVHYRHPVDLVTPGDVVFLSAGDAYALRCAYLHEGRGNILNQRAREALSHIHFVAPKEGRYFHCQRVNAMLILQVDIFCREMIDAVGRWSNDVRTDQAVQERLQSLLQIHEM
jgi:hypothetical protein